MTKNEIQRLISSKIKGFGHMVDDITLAKILNGIIDLIPSDTPAYYDFGDVSYTGAAASAIRVPLTDEQLNTLLASNKLAINLNIHIEDEYEGTPFEDSVELNGIYSFVISNQRVSIFNYVEGNYTNDLQGSEGYIHVGLSLDTTEGSSAFVLTPGII